LIWDSSIADEDVATQPKFQGHKDKLCVFAPVMQELNDWNFIHVRAKKNEAVQHEVQALYVDAVRDYESLIESQIRINNLGAISTDDKYAQDGYYVVEWVSEAYTLQEAMVVEECGTEPMPAGTIVAKAKYLNSIRYARQWYDRNTTHEDTRLFLVKNVLDPELLTFPARPGRLPLTGAAGIPEREQRWVSNGTHNRLMIDKCAWKKMDLLVCEPEWNKWAEDAKQKAIDQAKEKEKAAEEQKEKRRVARVRGLCGKQKETTTPKAPLKAPPKATPKAPPKA
jgi:hypothetical protein